jgi:serine/threonine protein kinase
MLGNYRIEQVIASGATGTVYRARHAGSDEQVAIKRLVGRSTVQLEIEARLLSRLSHSQVVEIIDHFQPQENVYCIVMRLQHGSDLGHVLWDRGAPGLPVHDVIQWARQACDALSYIHGEQVVHGDIKPQNLILGSKGVVLVDFGAATTVDAGGTSLATAGTPRFMAPEVFAGRIASPRSDIYSLAATVWNLLTGTPPVYCEETQLAASVAGVSEELEQALRGALEMVPERRTPTATVFAGELGVPLSEYGGTSLALSVKDGLDRTMLESVVKTAAGIFEAAAASIALLDEATNELVYECTWGAGASEIVGVRLPVGNGIAGAVALSGEPQWVPDCRSDARFARQVARATGYVPHTMVVVPLLRDGVTIGTLSVLDRRDGRPYERSDLPPAELFGRLAISALDTTLGARDTGVLP